MFNLTLLASWNNIYYEVEGSSRHSTWQSRHVVSVNYWPADNMDLLQLQQFVSRISKSSIKKRWYGVCRYAKKIKKHSARFFVNNSRNSKVPKKAKKKCHIFVYLTLTLPTQPQTTRSLLSTAYQLLLFGNGKHFLFFFFVFTLRTLLQ
mgnify:FL=1